MFLFNSACTQMKLSESSFLCCAPGGESRGGGGDGGEGSSTWTISSERNQGNPGWTISRQAWLTGLDNINREKPK